MVESIDLQTRIELGWYTNQVINENILSKKTIKLLQLIQKISDLDIDKLLSIKEEFLLEKELLSEAKYADLGIAKIQSEKNNSIKGIGHIVYEVAIVNLDNRVLRLYVAIPEDREQVGVSTSKKIIRHLLESMKNKDESIAKSIIDRFHISDNIRNTVLSIKEKVSKSKDEENQEQETGNQGKLQEKLGNALGKVATGDELSTAITLLNKLLSEKSPEEVKDMLSNVKNTVEMGEIINSVLKTLSRVRS